MLKCSNPISKLDTVGPNSLPFRVGVVMPAKLVFPFFHGFLKFKRDIDFLSFDDDIRLYSFQERCRKSTCNAPRMLWAMDGVSLAVIVTVTPTAKCFLQSFNDWFMRHADHYVELHFGVTFFANPVVKGRDTNAALSVKQTCNIANVEFHRRALAEKSANSVDTQTGQYRAKQGEIPGVCREHVPTPKGKICSDLHRNMQRLAEMTGLSCVLVARHIRMMITECNSKYLFFRPYRGRNFVALGDERMSTNQDAVVRLLGFAGNMTSSGPQFSGVAIE